MNANKQSTAHDWVDLDDAPDLSKPEWVESFLAVKAKPGRPKVFAAKVSTTIRLDPDVLAHFRAGGGGWQSRINAALRAAITPKRKGAVRAAPFRSRRHSRTQF
ncbi:MAG: BrnA antitoxin family protein [Bosea sp. (in: a-proteobacteria)]